MSAPARLLSGRLEAFQPAEVLQWLAHRAGSRVVRFRPDPPQPGRPPIALHVVDGIARGLRRDEDRPQPPDAPGVDRASEEAHPRGRAPVPARDCLPRPGALGGRLVDRAWLSPGELRLGLELQRWERRKNDGRPLGRVLTGLDLLAPERLAAVLREQALDGLTALLTYRRGGFVVYAGELDPPVLPIDERLEPLLLRVAHRLDGCGAPPAV